ncbi:AraC family transcriptional regulator [Marinomonas sp. S3726]|uniref:AraC family transcriptional regulator n=1 Tax=Marinomonas sp. S3726 TaxID=579484 RepID=UPI0005FA9472|nr:AraC family transcriptional regulator [Marinomonas sp. S3726]KJZ10381.1 AraC family transcriptional regulator [Marinomonas sp. S3726]
MHPIQAFQVKHHKIKTLSHEEHSSQTEHILMLVNKGKLSMKYQNQVELSENMLTLIPPGVAHTLVAGEDLDIWWMGFCPSCLTLDFDASLLQTFRQIRLGALPVFQVSKDRALFINRMFEELDQLHVNNEADIEVIQKSLITLILHEVNKASKPFETRANQTDIKVSNALDFIQQHYLTPISLKDVANAIHCSPSHLAYLVKLHTGYTVGQWILNSRLTQACSRLIHSDQDINHLVEELGWHDVTHFIRQFKKAYGITPAAWRKQQKNHFKQTDSAL